MYPNDRNTTLRNAGE